MTTLMTLLLWLQQSVTPKGSFFPDTLQGWLQTIAIIGGSAISAGTVLWRLGKGWVNRELKALKDAREAAIATECKDRKLADSRIEERTMELATHIQTIMGKVELYDRFTQRSEMDRGDLRSQLGNAQGKIDTLGAAIHAAELARATEMGELRVMMARIEGKLDALQLAQTNSGPQHRRAGDPG